MSDLVYRLGIMVKFPVKKALVEFKYHLVYKIILY